MAQIITRTLNGWNPWHSIKTLRDGIPVPHSGFPPRYLPASSFWAQSYGLHCEFNPPWVGRTDAYDAFLLGGGAAPSLVGALGGLDNVSLLFEERTVANWGIGYEYHPPMIGYCIGEDYKEMGYIFLSIVRAAPLVIATNSYIDVFQRSKLKRMYIHHGNVVRYDIFGSGEDTQHILTLDINESIPEGLDPSSLLPFDIDIYSQAGGVSFSVSVSEIRDNYQLVIDDPGDNIIKSGDFYKLNKVICIKDPYLLTGFYYGIEEDGISSESSSGYNLHITSDNRFYEEVIFTGSYVFKDSETEEVTAVTAGTSMYDSGNKEWVWIKGDNYLQSEIYRDNENRYKETSELIEETIEDEDEDGSDEDSTYETYGLEERTTGDVGDLVAWLEQEPSYIRLEISKGGAYQRTNWHAPVLTRSWAKQGDHYFKILGQPDGNIIDVSLKDVTGEFDLDMSSSISIFNQFAWHISEHFMGQRQYGIFGGPATASESTVTITTRGESSGTLFSNTRRFNPPELDGVNSFYNRFRKDTAISGGTIKAWSKYDGWRITDQQGKTFAIEDISFSSYPAEDENWKEYEIDITVVGDASALDGQEVWVTFDEPYDRVVSSQTSPLYSYSFTEAIDENDNPSICGDMSWVSTPIRLDIPFNAVVGICNGYLWGAGTPRFINSQNGLPLLVTTPSSDLGVSGFYNYLGQEDWVFYKDAYTNCLTARKGTLGFRERPQKIEISFGFPEAIEEDEFPISFNTDYDRTKLIRMTMPSISGEGACTFRLGSEEDWYGFLVNGGGEVDFQALRRLGFAPGEVTPDTFQYKDYYCSPAFLYHVNDFTFIDKQILYIGADTQDGPIYAKNGDPSDASVEYVNNKQVLSDIGRFDAHRMIDGEKIIVYSAPVPTFEIEGTLNNSSSADNQWSYPYGVYITGTANEGHYWGCPVVKDMKYNDDDKYQWPLMVLNNVDFQTSIYNPMSQTICIISKHFEGSYYYLASLMIPINSLIYQTELCEVSGEEGEYTPDFLWRPPALEEGTLWTDSDNLPTTLTDETYKMKDTFVRIMGQSGTDSQIESSLSDWGLVNGFVLSDGTYVVLYDEEDGVKMLFSRSHAYQWQQCKITMAKSAYSGLLINDTSFFYITPLGIECKKININHLNNALLCVEGSEDGFIEEIQGRFDDANTILIGSGQIDPQRLAGYEDVHGICRIFYYDNNGALACLYSHDQTKWDMAPNF